VKLLDAWRTLSVLDRKVLGLMGGAMALLALGGVLVYAGAERVELAGNFAGLRRAILLCGALAGLLLLVAFVVIHREMGRRLELERRMESSMLLLRGLSILDPLTGLFNRRHLEDSFRKLGQKHAGRPMALLLLDIDHFKQFNDRFGHDAGDQVLREIGGLLRRSVRPEDIVFRVGGEELVVLLPGLEPPQAAERAEALRLAVEQLKLSYGEQPMGSVSISIGCATFSGGAASLENALKNADLGLYEAKQGGRNRVVSRRS
jgi:diguanylate cyclase (GGDEF)-like protein